MAAANTSSNITHFSNVAVGITGGTSTFTLNGISQGGGATVAIGTGTPYTVLAANSGKLHLIPDMAANSAINLPTAAAGLEYEFMYSGVAADAHDHTINTGSATNFYIGSVQFHDTDDDSTVDVPSDNNSNAIFTINNAYSGTVFKLTCDGTNWYLRGIVVSDTAPTLTDIA